MKRRAFVTTFLPSPRSVRILEVTRFFVADAGDDLAHAERTLEAVRADYPKAVIVGTREVWL